MSADWQVGDLALCVDDGRCTCCGDLFFNPNIVVVVSGVWTDKGDTWLSFAEVQPPDHDHWWLHTDFRKIRPDKHETCEPEFIELLTRIKRKVSA